MTTDVTQVLLQKARDTIENANGVCVSCCNMQNIRTISTFLLL